MRVHISMRKTQTKVPPPNILNFETSGCVFRVVFFGELPGERALLQGKTMVDHHADSMNKIKSDLNFV